MGQIFDKIFDIISSCVDHIFEGDKIFMGKDIDKTQMREFFESMNNTQFAKVQKFFETMPKIVREFELQNPKTGKRSSVILKGLNDFFNLLSHNTLEAYYELNFNLMQHHKYSLTEIESMMHGREIFMWDY